MPAECLASARRRLAADLRVIFTKNVSWVSYILQRAVTGMEKQVRIKYPVSGPSKTPFENTHNSDKKQFIDANV